MWAFVDYLKRSKLGRAFVISGKYFFQDYVRIFVDDYFENNAFAVRRLGNLNPDKVICYIKIEGSSHGFFMYWKYSLMAISFAEENNMIPVINWTDNSPYYNQNYGSNPFEYFFDRVSDISIEEAERSCFVVYGYKKTSGVLSGYKKYNFKENLDVCVQINKKYFHIRDKIRNDIEAQIRDLLQNKTTLGVHIRGVEWGKIKDHPIPIALEEYVRRIRKAINVIKFDQIFIATDSEETICAMRKEFGDKIVTFDDVVRTPVGSHNLVIFDKKRDGFRLGFEVLRDVLSLTRCEGIVAGTSNVSFAVRVFKRTEGKAFEYEDFFENRIAQIGKSSRSISKKGKTF